MEFQRLEIRGRGGVPIGHVELIATGPSEGDYKIVVQLQKGYQVLALRSDMCSGRISGILGKLNIPPPPTPPPLGRD
jgi:hypothetical protein